MPLFVVNSESCLNPSFVQSFNFTAVSTGKLLIMQSLNNVAILCCQCLWQCFPCNNSREIFIVIADKCKLLIFYREFYSE